MKLQLKRSNVLELGAAKEPTSAQMEYGELAVNYNDGDPALFIKDSADNIIRIGGAGSIGSGDTPSGPVPPSTGNEIGDIFFDTTLNSLVYWDGTSWNEISDSQNSAKIYVGSLAEINNDVVANARSNGFLWWNTEDGTLYVWYEDGNTEQWVVAVPSVGSGGSAAVSSGPFLPNSGEVNELFFNTTEGRLYIYYDDGTSQEWVEACPGGGGGGSGGTIGEIVAWASPSVPTGWLECDGSPIPSQYTNLIALVGANTPDLRGEFIRGWANGAGVDPGRALLSNQADEFKSHNHQCSYQAGTASPTGTATPAAQRSNNQDGPYVKVTGGAETRPRNVALMYIINADGSGSGGSGSGGGDYVLKAGDTMTGDLAFTESTLSTDKLTLSADSSCLGLFGQIARAGVGFRGATSSYGMVTWVPAGSSITRPERFYNYYANLNADSAGTFSQVGFSASSVNDAGVPVAGFQTQGDWNLQSGGAKGLDLTVAKNTAGSTNYNIYAGYSTGQAEVARSYFGSDVVFGKNPATASPGYGTAALGYLYKFSDGVTYISNTNASFRLNRSAAGNIIEFRQGGEASVSGKIAVNGLTTSYVTSSDYRLKENVVPIGEAANRLKLLRPSQFNFKIEPSVVVDGFIAHEVEEVVPEAVSGVKDAVDEHGEIDPQGIDQSKLVPLLTAALQEALARIETLEAEVQQLSDKLDSF